MRWELEFQSFLVIGRSVGHDDEHFYGVIINKIVKMSLFSFSFDQN